MLSETPELPSITAVAKLAGVSIATVSRVLNKSKPVASKTRERVEAAVTRLGYRPNAFGRSLRKAESRLILVLVPDFSNPYYAEIIQGIESITRVRGYSIVLADSPEVWTTDSTALDALFNGMTDGVISLAHIDAQPELIETVRHQPWVSCSEVMPAWSVPYVSIDHRQAAIDAVQYLINRGHSRIGLISSEENYLWSQQRCEGYKLALKRARIKLDPELIQTVSRTEYAFGSEAAGRFLTLEVPPTAVFAMSDTLAIGAIKAFHRAGKHVPKDIAVIGFDNIPIADVFEPGLTTIAQPMRELGVTATKLLLERLAGGKPISRTLRHSLIVRESA